MKQIGSEEKKVIVFMGGGYNIITQEEENIIMQASTTGGLKGCKLKSGDWVTFSSISRIIGENKFYEENPKLRPSQVSNQFDENYAEYTKSGSSQIRKPTKRARELMLEGLAEYCRQNPNAHKAKKMLEEKSLFT